MKSSGILSFVTDYGAIPITDDISNWVTRPPPSKNLKVNGRVHKGLQKARLRAISETVSTLSDIAFTYGKDVDDVYRMLNRLTKS